MKFLYFFLISLILPPFFRAATLASSSNKDEQKTHLSKYSLAMGTYEINFPNNACDFTTLKDLKNFILVNYGLKESNIRSIKIKSDKNEIEI